MERDDDIEVMTIPGWEGWRARLALHPGVLAIRAEAWLPRLVVTADGLIDRSRPGSIIGWYSCPVDPGTVLFRIETRDLDREALGSLLNALRFSAAQPTQA
jgi:hypothetical protein